MCSLVFRSFEVILIITMILFLNNKMMPSNNLYLLIGLVTLVHALHK